MSETLFTKIINRDIPADIVYEDDQCLAFRDISPKAPMHILVVPRKPIPMVSKAEASDSELLGHLLIKAGEIAAEQGYADAFRLLINNGEEAGQTVFHVHVHILGGEMHSLPE